MDGSREICFIIGLLIVAYIVVVGELENETEIKSPFIVAWTKIRSDNEGQADQTYPAEEILFQNSEEPEPVEVETSSAVPVQVEVISTTLAPNTKSEEDTTRKNVGNDLTTSPKTEYMNFYGAADMPGRCIVPHPTGERTDGKFPEFIVIGVDKCGTSALAKFLTQHSKLHFLGETYFFSRLFSKGIEWYKKLGKHALSTQMVFEKSPTYYKNRYVASRIHEFNPDMKIVLVVCNNVRRLLSRYLHIIDLARREDLMRTIGQDQNEFFLKALNTTRRLRGDFENMQPDYENNMDKLTTRLLGRLIREERPFVRKLNERTTFETIISDGFYSVYLHSWMRLFPRENILVIDGSELNDHPAEQVIQVEDFLGLEREVDHESFLYHVERQIYCLRGPQPYACCPGGHKGRSIGIEIEEEVAKEICDFFRPFDRQLKESMQLNWPTWGIPCK